MSQQVSYSTVYLYVNQWVASIRNFRILYLLPFNDNEKINLIKIISRIIKNNWIYIIKYKNNFFTLNLQKHTHNCLYNLIYRNNLNFNISLAK